MQRHGHQQPNFKTLTPRDMQRHGHQQPNFKTLTPSCRSSGDMQRHGHQQPNFKTLTLETCSATAISNQISKP
jgi:hypothetical protein